MQRKLLRGALLSLLIVLGTAPLLASDHADAPNNSSDQGTDLADSYMFLDPNDNSRVVMIMTFHGFIVPGENANFFVFDETARYNFEIENTGDAVPDRFYRVTFGRKGGTATTPQTASIELPDGRIFNPRVTPASNTADAPPAPIIDEDPVTGIRAFIGITDDPFFFDIPAFGRFIASVRAGTPNPSVFSRGRDSFSGYNVQAIALSVPASQLRGTNGNTVGLNQTAQRRILEFIGPNGSKSGSGRWINADRQGNPAINVALVPFPLKNAYNNANPSDDAAGRFANDIVGVLRSLGTNDTNIGILASVVVTSGDILRIDTSVANSGPGGGNNMGAAFPNGRRLQDDVIDTALFFIANQNTLGDSVNANELTFRDAFPFLAPAHAPRPTGTVDDSTRN